MNPNVLFILMDNLGYGEVGCYGGGDETIAKVLSRSGYATGLFGKWHLGNVQGRLPTDQGFDEWYGIPDATDETLWPTQPGFDPSLVHAAYITSGETYDLTTRPRDRHGDHRQGDRLYGAQCGGAEAVLHVRAYTLVHYPTLPSAEFKGATGNGEWADCLAQMDHNVGRLLDMVERLVLRDDTIVVFTNDNSATCFSVRRSPRCAKDFRSSSARSSMRRNGALLTDPWVFGSARQAGAVSAEGEHGQGDEGLGGAEAERDAGQESGLGVPVPHLLEATKGKAPQSKELLTCDVKVRLDVEYNRRAFEFIRSNLGHAVPRPRQKDVVGQRRCRRTRVRIFEKTDDCEAVLLASGARSDEPHGRQIIDTRVGRLSP